MKSAATGLGYQWAELGLFRVLGIAIMRRKPESLFLAMNRGKLPIIRDPRFPLINVRCLS
jgi:hypothetical protein